MRARDLTSLPTDLVTARHLRRAGIVYPLVTVQEARRVDLELAVLCAVLEQETGGGHNVFGHDPTVYVGAGEVTEAKYRAYKRLRDAQRPRRMQGVGPMQLTWWAYQDEADRLGGCWRPRCNIRVGAQILSRALHEHGLHRALAAYNGSERYALEVERRLPKWRRTVARVSVDNSGDPCRELL